MLLLLLLPFLGTAIILLLLLLLLPYSRVIAATSVCCSLPVVRGRRLLPAPRSVVVGKFRQIFRDDRRNNVMTFMCDGDAVKQYSITSKAYYQCTDSLSAFTRRPLIVN